MSTQVIVNQATRGVRIVHREEVKNVGTTIATIERYAKKNVKQTAPELIELHHELLNIFYGSEA
jgi:hypothetical protein